MQPVVKPLYDTAAFPDILIALARAVRGRSAAAVSERSLHEALQERHAPGNRARWNELLAQGGIFPQEAAPAEHVRKVSLARPDLPQSRPNPEFPLQLKIYPSPVFHDGRGAALPWLQQLPDPMTTVVWGSWIEINPQTAARLGISHGDLVEVRSAAGTMKLPAVLYPGIRPEVVAAPMGQGHRGMGRYADDRGANPTVLTTVAKESLAVVPAMVPVQVRRVGPAGDLVTAEDREGSYRRELLGL
jgi:anaerobic selenocysteine-containing dehydrogenase